MKNPMRLVATAGLLLFMALGVSVSALPAGAQGGGNQNSHGQNAQGNSDQNSQGQNSQGNSGEGNFPGNSGRQNCEVGHGNSGNQGNSGDHQNFGDRGNSGDHGNKACGTVTVTKHVTSRRKPSDSFLIKVMAPNGRVVGTASTGTGNSATAGPFTVHPGALLLSEQATPLTGTDLRQYQANWSCTDNGRSLKIKPSKDGAVRINDHFGENIACTVTNQVPPVSVPFATPEAGMGLAGAAGLLGLGWVVVRRRRRLAA